MWSMYVLFRTSHKKLLHNRNGPTVWIHRLLPDLPYLFFILWQSVILKNNDPCYYYLILIILNCIKWWCDFHSVSVTSVNVEVLTTLVNTLFSRDYFRSIYRSCHLLSSATTHARVPWFLPELAVLCSCLSVLPQRLHRNSSYVSYIKGQSHLCNNQLRGSSDKVSRQRECREEQPFMKDHCTAILSFWDKSVGYIFYQVMSSHSLAPTLSSSI